MANLIQYTHCPSCGSKEIAEVLIAKDYTVSQELFEIWECGNCSLRFTQHVPDETGISPYYKSDSYVSHSNTKKGLINRLYHLVRKTTITQKVALVKKQSGVLNGHLLDIGAGTGAFAVAMQNNGWQVTGLEPDEDARKMAKKEFGIHLQKSKDLQTIEPESIDVITMWHVLEHVHDLHGYLEKFKQVLHKNGTLIIAVPNYTSFDAEYYGGFWAAYDVPRHLYHFSPKSMETLMQQHGFLVQEFLPMKYDSFYVSMLSEKYKNEHNNLTKAFSIGLKSNSKAGRNAKKYSSVIYVIKKVK